MIYDQASGNLLTSIADVGGVGHFNAVSNFTYTNLGLPLTAINALGVTTLYGYDNLGDPTSITHDLGGAGHLNQTTVMGYSTLVDVVSLTDPKGNVYASAYDADRRLTTSTTPGAPGAPAGRTTAIAYDADGRVLQTAWAAHSLRKSAWRQRPPGALSRGAFKI
jgi:YD repeat-containing protein